MVDQWTGLNWPRTDLYMYMYRMVYHMYGVHCTMYCTYPVVLSRESFPMLLVANKVDLQYNRRVSIQEGYALAEKLKVSGEPD